MMPPPPAPVAQPAPSVVAPPGGTVTRQSAMNPQGLFNRLISMIDFLLIHFTF